MIQNTFWENGRLVRRSVEVIGDRVSLPSYVLTLAMIAVVVLLSGCGAAGDGYDAPEVVQDEPAAEREIPLCPGEPEPETGECQRLVYGSPGVPGYCNRFVPCPSAAEPAPVKPALPIMYVTPVPELLELTLLAAELIRLKSGALIELSETGFPVYIYDRGRQGSASCHGAKCGVYLSTETVEENDGFALNNLTHEFVHLLSKFGACSDETDASGHLPQGNIVSNGNPGYSTMSWTDADTRLACSCGAC